MHLKFKLFFGLWFLIFHVAFSQDIGITKGYVVVLGDLSYAATLAQNNPEIIVYSQVDNTDASWKAASEFFDTKSLFGTRVFLGRGPLTQLHLAENFVDVLVAKGSTMPPDSEVLRVLRSQGKAFLGTRELIKPLPSGMDDWPHLYHSPSNSNFSKDSVLRAPYISSFFAGPRFGPVPQAAVAAGGILFKAFGHIAFHKREEPYLNTLIAVNGYNGTILWSRPITPGINIHRSTMIATSTDLYIGDTAALKIIDPQTGELKDEYIPDVEGGTFWKWMGLEKGILYAVVGAKETLDPTQKHANPEPGWPWQKISPGFNAATYQWGFGRTVIAVDLAQKKVLWSHREQNPADCRAVCMEDGKIFIFRYGEYLVCLNAQNGDELWRQTPANNPTLFNGMGAYSEGQDWSTNWRSANYLKCGNGMLYFAGPQISGAMMVISMQDGSVKWQNPDHNMQLVVANNFLYGISGNADETSSKKFDPASGNIVKNYDMRRASCTRPTGNASSIFFRAHEGSSHLNLETEVFEYFPPMRPDCFDGPTIANGHVYFWPMACDCNLQMLGLASLAPAGNFNFEQKAVESERLIKTGDITNVATFDITAADWPNFRKDNQQSATSTASLPTSGVHQVWEHIAPGGVRVSSPTTSGGLVFVGRTDGAVIAFEAKTGKRRWTAYTGGAVRYPPAISQGRAYVGAGDSWVYVYEAATGRLLWRFKAGPQERRLPFYNSLLSTWPVAGGVLVENGVAYTAAGIVNHDGTHVYALDAINGSIKWQNNTSGKIYPTAPGGIDVQGPLLFYNDVIYFPGGTLVSPAAYDITDGTALRTEPIAVESVYKGKRGQELFLYFKEVYCNGMPLYKDPQYEIFGENWSGSTSEKSFLAVSGGKAIFWVHEYHGTSSSVSAYPSSAISLDNLPKFGTNPPFAGDWSHTVPMNGQLLAVASNAVVVHEDFQLHSLNLASGATKFKTTLSAKPEKWGLAIDRDGRMFISLEDGRLICYGTDPQVSIKEADDGGPDFDLRYSRYSASGHDIRVQYTLKHTSKVEIVVYNIFGKQVSSLVSATKPSGNYQLNWKGTNTQGQPLPIGWYTLSMKTPGFVKHLQLLIFN
ncbi:MAG: PQQ-binding-like beta-propeller repeat protein [Fibrobacteria bacterium]|nr:PQQ-binding-like beta-propeller repeat protein [Fibrobacteria bacterium]